MEQDPTQKAATTNGAKKPALTDLRPAQHNLAGVLDGQNVAARDTRRSSLRRRRTQGSHSHCRIAQKPTKAYLASPLAA